jgi:hypothetical protein
MQSKTPCPLPRFSRPSPSCSSGAARATPDAPRRVTAATPPAWPRSPMHTGGRLVQWGGVLTASRNFKDRRELGVTGYALDACARPETGSAAVGRFILVRPGDQETADYRPGLASNGGNPVDAPGTPERGACLGGAPRLPGRPDRSAQLPHRATPVCAVSSATRGQSDREPDWVQVQTEVSRSVLKTIDSPADATVG